MISIKIKDFNKNSLTVLTSFWKLDFVNEVWKFSKLNISFPYDNENILKLTANNRKIWNTINVIFPKNWEEKLLFEWIIVKVVLSWKIIEVECLDYTGWTRDWESNRAITSDLVYNLPTNQIVSSLYSYFQWKYPLPFEIWINNDTTVRNITFEAWLTFYDCLVRLYEDYNVIRRCKQKLDIWSIWEMKLWLRKYDNNDRFWSDIIDFDREDSLYQLQKNNTLKPYPMIQLDTDKIDRWNYEVWDKKTVQIRTSLEWWAIWFIWMVKKIDIKAKNTKLEAKIEIADEYSKEVSSSFEKVMQELLAKKIQ